VGPGTRTGCPWIWSTTDAESSGAPASYLHRQAAVIHHGDAKPREVTAEAGREDHGADPAVAEIELGRTVRSPPVDALAEAAIGEFRQLHDRLRTLVKELDETALDRVPAAGENSIAVLVTHTLGSELGWLHRAADRPFKRDRDAEFRARALRSALTDAIDATEREGAELIRATADSGLAASRGVFGGQELTAGGCITHSLAHTAEHVGHAELTRNLLGYRAQ